MSNRQTIPPHLALIRLSLTCVFCILSMFLLAASYQSYKIGSRLNHAEISYSVKQTISVLERQENLYPPPEAKHSSALDFEENSRFEFSLATGMLLIMTGFWLHAATNFFLQPKVITRLR